MTTLATKYNSEDRLRNCHLQAEWTWALSIFIEVTGVTENKSLATFSSLIRHINPGGHAVEMECCFLHRRIWKAELRASRQEPEAKLLRFQQLAAYFTR